ncbi:MAG: hypothetical protein ABSF63_14070 [Candidatus Bathyarchaeia archaeon]
MERRLRLDEKDRKLLLDALYVYLKTRSKKDYDNAREAHKLAFAIYMTRTGRRARYGLSSELPEMTKDLLRWSQEVTYRPKPPSEKEQAEANALIARIRG